MIEQEENAIMSLHKCLATPKSQNIAAQEWESEYPCTLPTHVGRNILYNQRIDLQGTQHLCFFCIGKFWGDSSNASISLRFLPRFGRQCLAVSGVKRLLHYFSLLVVGQDHHIPIQHHNQSELADSRHMLRFSPHPVGSLPSETPRCPVEVHGNQRLGLPYRWGPTKATW